MAQRRTAPSTPWLILLIAAPAPTILCLVLLIGVLITQVSFRTPSRYSQAGTSLAVLHTPPDEGYQSVLRDFFSGATGAVSLAFAWMRFGTEVFRLCLWTRGRIVSSSVRRYAPFRPAPCIDQETL